MNSRGNGQVDPDKLKALVQRAIDIKSELADISGDLSSDLTVACETMNLHKSAFNLCVSLKRMEEVKRRAFIDAFESYVHILKLDEFAQTDLVDTVKKVGGTLRSVS